MEKGVFMNGETEAREKYPWAGPALFTVVLVLICVFFWWFVSP